MEMRKLDVPPVLYYLTPTGYFPESANGLTRAAIDTIAFYPEILRWLEDCLKHTPENFYCRKNLTLLLEEVYKITRKIGVKVYPDIGEIMNKFFSALDKRFDESFCKKYLLKRGGNKRGEIGDHQSYQRELCKFFSEVFSAPGISFYYTDAAGKIIRECDRELWFRVECHNGGAGNLCASFRFFDRLLGNFDGVIDRIELHDTQDKPIDFNFWYLNEELKSLTNQEKLDSIVEHIMVEIESLLRRFAYG